MNQTKFSTPEQIQASYEFLNNLSTPECGGCSTGIGMCYHTPCIGTPEDIEKLLDAGYADQLMMDWWIGPSSQEALGEVYGMKEQAQIHADENVFRQDITYIAPAIRGKGGMKTPLSKKGVCGFLKDNLCTLHDKGLKPLQGRTACCSINRVFKGETEHFDERIYLMHTWNSEKGKEIIERWKKMVNFDQKYQDDKIETPKNGIEAFFSMLKLLADLGSKPESLPEDTVERELITIEYDKPNC